MLDAFTVEEITRGGLRIGTVHSFQGSECDELVVSLALTDTDPAASWRFVDDPHLMAVLTTRARRLVHVITSAVGPPGLVGAYLRHADEPPTGYPVGRWRVDLVVGDDSTPSRWRPGPTPTDPMRT